MKEKVLKILDKNIRIYAALSCHPLLPEISHIENKNKYDALCDLSKEIQEIVE